jgi:hypothetical protein
MVSKPAWANSLRDPILKKPFTKQGWWSGSRGRFKPWNSKKEKKKRKWEHKVLSLMALCDLCDFLYTVSF